MKSFFVSMDRIEKIIINISRKIKILKEITVGEPISLTFVLIYFNSFFFLLIFFNEKLKKRRGNFYLHFCENLIYLKNKYKMKRRGEICEGKKRKKL
jgi:hypothetical protein